MPPLLPKELRSSRPPTTSQLAAMHPIRFSRTALRRVRAPAASLVRTYSVPTEFKQPPADPQLGDYPQLPAISKQYRDPRAPWFDAQNRRNFEEPMHEQEEVLTVWAYDVYPMPPQTALFQFSIAASLFAAFFGVCYFIVPARPAVPREYPYDGLQEMLGGLEKNKANGIAED